MMHTLRDSAAPRTVGACMRSVLSKPLHTRLPPRPRASRTLRRCTRTTTAVATPPEAGIASVWRPSKSAANSQRRILFADIDGTLVHYEVMAEVGTVTGMTSQNGILNLKLQDTGADHNVMLLPPSSTGMQGMISLRSLHLLASWRAAGNLLVIISGARTSTMLQRLTYLPAADAVVTENGGRVWLRDAGLPTMTKLAEDWDWRRAHEDIAGPPSQDPMPADTRQGALWDLYREMCADGWAIDVFSYHCAFRVKLRAPKTEADVAALRARLPELGLTSSYNLGCLDVYPYNTGKEGAARYLMDHYGVPPASCVFMCDDDNDLGLAALVPKVFLPSIGSETVRAAAAAEPDKFVVARRPGVFGTEESLEAILAECSAASAQASPLLQAAGR